MEENNQLNNNFQNNNPKKTIENSQKSGKKLGKSIFQIYNLNKIGSIKYAKLHQSANRPLRKVKDDIDDDELEHCKCCKLPGEHEGLLEKFHFCDNPDDFISCGEGVSLYFTFFTFAIIVLIITFFLVSLYNIIFSKKCYDEIYKLCNSNLKNILIEKDCLLFTEKSKKAKNAPYTIISESYFFMFNSVNNKFYRNFYYNLNSKSNQNVEKVIVNSSYMNFMCLITLFIFNIYWIIIINSDAQNINMSILSLSDYSIFLTHVRHVLRTFLRERKEIIEKKVFSDGIKTEYDYKGELYSKLGIDNSLIDSSDLEQFFSFLKNKVFVFKDGKQLTVKKINFCFKISELMELQEKENLIDEKKSKIKHHPYQNKRNEDLQLSGQNKKYFSSFLNLKCCETGESLKDLEEQQNKLIEEIGKLMEKTKEETLDYFSGCLIICVDTIAEQEKFLKENKSIAYIHILNFLRYIFCRFTLTPSIKNINRLRSQIIFERAPEPEDIKFENLQYANSISRVSRTFLVYFLSFILLFICFIIVTALNSLQKYTDDKYDYHIVVAYTISLLITCFMQIINFIFEKLLDFLTEIEKLPTTTSYFLSRSIKLTFFSFLNQGIIPLISDYYIDSKGYEYLIINMLMVFLVNSIVVPILWTFSFSYLYKKFRIWLIEWDITPDNPEANHKLTQKELNDLYELPSMQIDEKYSYIFQTLLISFLYIQIFPLGVVISLIGFLLGYAIEKYNFCNKYRRPEMLNDRLCKVYINYFIICLFASGLGDFIFNKDVYNTNMWSLINIILFGFLIIVPYCYIIDNCTKYCIDLKESKIHTSKFEDVYDSFKRNYENTNPLTKKESDFKKNSGNLGKANLMKSYYNDSKNRNIFKTQKSLRLKQSIVIKNIDDDDFEEIEEVEIPSPDDGPTNIKEQVHTVYIKNNNNHGKEPIPINVTSERKINNYV